MKDEQDTGDDDRWRRTARAVWRAIRDIPAFIRYVVQRFFDDRGFETAASLTYTSLLGLVPLLAVVLAALSAFPAFDDVRQQVRDMIMSPLTPGASAAVHVHLNAFLENTRKLGVIAALGIGVTAILMLNTIETTLNTIWRVVDLHSLPQRFLIFWGLLTLPPVLLAGGISLTSYFTAFAGDLPAEGAIAWFRRLTPLALETAAFTVLFIAAPNRSVKIKHAFAGGLMSAILFEGLKQVFGLYVKSAAAQEAIYGALAAIPFFLLWMYATWTVVLIGAEIAAALPEWKGAIAAARRQPLTAGERLTASIGVLTMIWRAVEAGAPAERSEVERALPAGSADLGQILERLQSLGYVAPSVAGSLLLARDLDEVTLYDLYRDLGLALIETPTFLQAVHDEAPALATPRLSAIMADAEAAKARLMSSTIKTVILDRMANHAETASAPAAPDVRDATPGSN